MRLWWNHLWRSEIYRRATAEERRLIEIRFSVARALRKKRRDVGMRQEELAKKVGIAQATLSRVERASNRVSLEIALRCLLALGCTDAELGAVFDASQNGGIRILRRRAAERFFPKPGTTPTAVRDQRYYSMRRRVRPACPEPEADDDLPQSPAATRPP